MSWTPYDLIDKRLTVHAQRALMRLLNGNVVEQKIAADLITAVKSGDLEGIYVVNQAKPALRARDIGTYWWLVIPKGQDIACMTAPSDRPPLLALSTAAVRYSARVDQALVKGWAMLLDTSTKAKMSNYQFSSTNKFSITESSSGIDGNQLHPYSPEQLRILVDAMGWDEEKKHKALKQFIAYALWLHQAFGTTKSHKQLEQDVERVFGKDILSELVEVDVSELSQFRQDIIASCNHLENRTVDGPPSIKQSPGTSCVNYAGYVINSLNVEAGKPRNIVNRHYQYNRDRGEKGKYKLRRGPKFPGGRGILGFYDRNHVDAGKLNALTEAEEDMPKTLRPKPGDTYVLFKENRKDIRHIGYIKSIKVVSDTEEIWITSDGGQEDSTTKKGIATKENKRRYNPKDNKVDGIKDKGWVSGWIDADKILERQ